MKFIVGLGNPGAEYAGTKHNIGFALIAEIAKEFDIKINKEAHGSVLGKGRIRKEDVMLIMPQTYMNLSGKAVEELFREKAKSIEDIIVICDDINMELGKIRLRTKGSSGGHKGLASVIRSLGRDDFARLRIGIATEAHKGDITNYVLTPFRRKHLRNVRHALSLAEEALLCFIEEGAEKAMTKFNRRRAGTS